MSRRWVTSSLLLLAGAPAVALGPTLEAAVEPARITVGDRVAVQLSVRGGGSAAPPQLPDLDHWGEAEVLDAGPFLQVPGDAGEPAWEARWVVTAFRPGPVALPPLSVSLPAFPEVTLETPPSLAFTVESVLPEGEEAEPLPPAPPRALPVGAPFWWAVALLGAACLAALAALWLRPRPVTAGSSGRLAPLPALLAELERLEREAGLPELHTRLSMALRRFLDQAAGLPAVERTTSEIQRGLRQAPWEAALSRQLVELLRRCDTVKFARQQASREQGLEQLAEARRVALAIDDKLRAAQPAEEAAA